MRHPAQIFGCLVAGQRPEAQESRYAAHRSASQRCSDLVETQWTDPMRGTTLKVFLTTGLDSSIDDALA
jgi:hypothetical protein